MLNIIPVKQKKGYWCGPASLKMVLAYYDVIAKESDLAKQTQANPQTGATAQALLETAKLYGLTGFIKNGAELSDLKHYVLDRQIPVIVDWFQIDDGHYSVVTNITKSHIYLADPYIGQLVSFKPKAFYRIWFDFHGAFLKQKSDLVLRQMLVIYRKNSK